MRWTYEGTTDAEAFPPVRHMFQKYWVADSNEEFRALYRWLETEIGLEGKGWSVMGSDRILIDSDDHALSFRMRWC